MRPSRAYRSPRGSQRAAEQLERSPPSVLRRLGVVRLGTIVVETARDVSNSLVRIVVADTGPGIPPAERDKLFLPYYSTKGRGSGLGLAIVRRIIAEHGGSIEATDNDPHGTVFTIEWPA